MRNFVGNMGNLGNDKTHVRKALAGVTAVMMLLGLAGCAPQFAGTPLSETRGTVAPAASGDGANGETSASDESDDETADIAEDSAISEVAIARLQDTVRMEKGNDYLAFADAHEWQEDVTEQHTAFEDGQYEFSVYCVGPATLDFDLAIGDAKGEAVIGCGDGDKVGSVSMASAVLDVTSADTFSISATPVADPDADDTVDTTLPPAYIAYRIDKVS